MKFELDKSEKEKLTKWQEAIKEIYGEYGAYTYKFTPNGIGCEIAVYSHLADKEIDLTDVSKW